MTTIEIQKIEKIAAQSVNFARKAIHKSNELAAYLSLLEYRTGRVTKRKSVSALFKELKIR